MDIPASTGTGRERVLGMINAAWMCQAIAALCDLGVPDALAAAAAPADTLSESLGIAPDALARLLRAAAALGLVDGRDDGSFALTADGALLTTGTEESLRAWALLNATRGWALWGELAAGVRSGRNVRDRARLETYATFENDPDAARVFNRAMGSLTQPVALGLRERVRFDGTEVVVDVGGGAGHLVLPLLAAHPRMNGIIFDLAHARAAACDNVAAAGLGARCLVVAGSFFEHVPGGGDVYLLKSVLHNWNDADALRILEACRRAMHPRARLLVIERVLSARVGPGAIDRENARSDLQMLLACDGRERTEAEFDRLLDGAGLRRVRTIALTPLVYALEALPIGKD